MPPIKPDGGGSLRSTANSCPASPPIKAEIMTYKRLSRRREGELSLKAKYEVSCQKCDNNGRECRDDPKRELARQYAAQYKTNEPSGERPGDDHHDHGCRH